MFAPDSARAVLDPYPVFRPLLFSLDAERAHRATLELAGRVSRSAALCDLARRLYAPKVDPALAVSAFGLDFPTPVGLAAGLDKDGEAIDLWPALGFGFVELGTVTPGSGQPGNDPPRLERLVEDRAIVNRMGFNNRGAPALAERLARRRTTVPCGANLGKAKVTPLEEAPGDYEAGLRAVSPVADYVVVNVSSPNTPGLRDLQAVASLRPLLSRVQAVNLELGAASGRGPRPVLLKIAPDLADEDLDTLADLALETGMSGIIATNTTLRRELASRPARIEGGLSGAPLKPRALAVLRRLYARVGTALPLVGVGGIGSADDAYERIRAGATLVQVYTARSYGGPGLGASIVGGLGERLRRDGLESIAQAVGVDA